jgi:hypothetical protein
MKKFEMFRDDNFGWLDILCKYLIACGIGFNVFVFGYLVGWWPLI